MNLELELILRLLLAAVLGMAIGYQRERVGKPAGLRTHALICLGAALFTIISVYGFKSSLVDPSRVAAGVVAGIGFLGAGVIFRGFRGDRVAGLTTAASIWATAAVGLAAGVGMYLISFVAAVICVALLMAPKVRG